MFSADPFTSLFCLTIGWYFVGVLESHYKRALAVFGEEVVVKGGSETSQVHQTGGRRRVPDSHRIGKHIREGQSKGCSLSQQHKYFQYVQYVQLKF
jgi:hypothetical protein